jgi:SET domain-containing protein
LFIDAEAHGGVARMANHSCDPNCQLQKWTVGFEPRLVIAAIKDIPAGTEVRTSPARACTGACTGMYNVYAAD